MRSILVLAGIAFGHLAAPAFADTCDNAATQSDLTACYGAAFKAADKELNATYRQIEGRLGDDPDARKLLVAAERAIRAVFAAAPFRDLPRQFYGDRIAVNFNAREACL